jgi:hypothetical protein
LYLGYNSYISAFGANKNIPDYIFGTTIMVTGRESRRVLPALLVFGLFFWGTQLGIGHNTAAGQGSAREDGTLLVVV